ncbi:MAG: hypothetical protein WAV09_03425 [Minisyncoccia bacterium]
MTPYILTLLAAFGFAYVLGHATISLPFRTWLGGIPAKEPDGILMLEGRQAVPGALGPIGDFLCAMIECPACLGFWTGLGWGLAKMVPPPPEMLPFAWPITLGFIVSGSNFALSRLTRIS